MGLTFWIYFTFWYWDSYYKNGDSLNAMGKIIDGNDVEGPWISLYLVMFIIPAITLSVGTLSGLLGLIGSPRKFAIVGLIVNALPTVILVYFIYRLFVPFE